MRFEIPDFRRERPAGGCGSVWIVGPQLYARLDVQSYVQKIPLSNCRLVFTWLVSRPRE